MFLPIFTDRFGLWYTIICIRPKTDLVAEYHSTKKEYNLIPQRAVGVLKHDLNWP